MYKKLIAVIVILFFSAIIIAQYLVASQPTVKSSKNVISLTDKEVFITLYPGVPQEFSHKGYTGVGGYGGVPREISTYYCTITFDPNTWTFSATPPESRVYYLKVSEKIDEYYTDTQLYTGFYSQTNEHFTVGHGMGVDMRTRAVSPNNITLAMKGPGI